MSDIKQRFQTIRKALSQIHTKHDVEKRYIIDSENLVEVWGMPTSLQSYEVKDILAESWIREGLRAMESFLSKNNSDGVIAGRLFEVKVDEDAITLWIKTGEGCLSVDVSKSGAMGFWGGRNGESAGHLSKEKAVSLLSR